VGEDVTLKEVPDDQGQDDVDARRVATEPVNPSPAPLDGGVTAAHDQPGHGGRVLLQRRVEDVRVALKAADPDAYRSVQLGEALLDLDVGQSAAAVLEREASGRGDVDPRGCVGAATSAALESSDELDGFLGPGGWELHGKVDCPWGWPRPTGREADETSSSEGGRSSSLSFSWAP